MTTNSTKTMQALSEGTFIECGVENTKSKIAYDALERLATEMCLLLESTSEGIYGLDMANRCTFINAAGAQMIGYTSSEVLGQDMHVLLHHTRADGSPYPGCTCRMIHALGKDERCRVDTEVFWRKDGTAFPVEYSVNPIIENGVRHGAVITFSDITEHKERERQIREQARLLNLAHDSISVRDLEDRVQFWNRGAERLFGWTAEEIAGRDVKDFLYTDPDAFAAAKAAVLKDGEWRGESTLRSKDGRHIIVSTRWTLLRDDGGQPESVLVIKTDITEKKELEMRFLRAQRLESIGTLASGVAHDLNNILSPILMATPLLRDPLSPDAFEMLISTIETSAQRGAEIVKQVLTFARGVEGERMPLQLKHLVNEMERIAIKTFPKNIAITTQIAPDLSIIEGDATQLHQVLLNLCVNARDAMPGGGMLTIGAENFVVDESYAAMLPNAKVGGYVQLSVSDTGSGISREIVDKIFDPFFTTKEPGMGTGLGLSTVMGIIQSHGGFLSVRSQVGQGTIFKVFLPIATVTYNQPTGATEVPLPRGRGEKILFVDDEPGLRKVTATILKKHGYNVEVAGDGAEAIALYAMHQKEISVVLTDVMMPLMDGVALSRALRRLNPQVRVIASTGLSEAMRHNELKSLGVDTFLMKPYSTSKLLNTIDETLGAPMNNFASMS